MTQTPAQVWLDMARGNERFVAGEPLHTVWSDGAVLGGKVNYRTIDHGKDSAEPLMFADIWAKRGGTWRVVYTQVSPAK